MRVSAVPLSLALQCGQVVVQPREEIGTKPFRPCLEFLDPTGWGLAVPWADVLADVAAEHPSVELLGRLIGEHSAMLDSPVADASARVELIRARERFGRAGIEASRAAPAVVRLVRAIISQLDIRQQGAEEREAPEFAADQHGILTDPANSGEPGVVALE